LTGLLKCCTTKNRRDSWLALETKLGCLTTLLGRDVTNHTVPVGRELGKSRAAEKSLRHRWQNQSWPLENESGRLELTYYTFTPGCPFTSPAEAAA